MNTSTTEIFRQALDLDERDRATLAGLLIESLEEKPDEGLEAAWKAEINRRISEIDSGEVDMIPWEDVKMGLMKNNQ